MRWLFGTTALAACTALAVAGCAVPHQQPAQRPAAPRSTTHPVTATSPPGRLAAAPPPSHQQRAEADAAAILGSFVPPPGARRLPSAPAAGGGTLRQPLQIPQAFHLLDKASWWQAPGQPQQVLAWERAHLPRRFAYAGDATSSIRGTVIMWGDQFSVPPVPGVLVERYLLVEVVSAGHGRTAIRVDAQVIWVPARPASERVPSAARVVTVSVLPGIGPGGAPRRGPVTITDPATVRRITALVDSLPLAPWTYISCPAFDGGGVGLTFRARAGGPALATVSSDMNGCPPIVFTIGGRPQPALADLSFDRQVAALAGLRLPGGTSAPGHGVADIPTAA